MKIFSFLNKYTPRIIEQTKVSSKPLFCQEYLKTLRHPRVLTKTSVSMHGQLNSINHFFITGTNPQNMDKYSCLINMTPRELTKLASEEFRLLKPTEEVHTVYRCISKKPEFFSEYPLYQKRLNTKVGDIINMREYAYATSDINYAKQYLPNNEGILYVMEIPQGSRGVSRIGKIGKNDEFAFDRSSMWECTGVEEVKDANNNYKIIKLRKKENFFDRTF
mgnify:CR=1 FL=1